MSTYGGYGTAMPTYGAASYGAAMPTYGAGYGGGYGGYGAHAPMDAATVNRAVSSTGGVVFSTCVPSIRCLFENEIVNAKRKAKTETQLNGASVFRTLVL